MIGLSFADVLFGHQAAVSLAEDDFLDRCCEILGIERSGDWPFDDTKFDAYDKSFELCNVTPGLVLAIEQQQRFWDLGFLCCWLNYTDKAEMYYSRNCTGEFKRPLPENAPASTPPAKSGDADTVPLQGGRE